MIGWGWVTWDTLIGSENRPPDPSFASFCFFAGGWLKGETPDPPCFNEAPDFGSSVCREGFELPDFVPKNFQNMKYGETSEAK